MVPDEFGSSKPLYFFVLPSYWGWTKLDNQQVQSEWIQNVLKKTQKTQYPLETDNDVVEERTKALLDGNSIN